MSILDAIPQESTADDAAVLIATAASELGIRAEPPDVRTLRLWRSKRRLTVEGRRFTRRNLIEVLVLLKLRQEGLTLQGAVERVLALDEERLRLLLTQSSSLPLTTSDAEPLITLHLLARGIIEQYRLVEKGAIVGHTDERMTGMLSTPLSLQQAMAHLSRYYFAEGHDDRASSVHQLLRLCTEPLHAWAPRALAELTQYRDAVLIDPLYLVPNEDCEAIAEEADGTNLADMIERHLHEALRATLAKLGEDADAAYTVIRAFIGHHPLATRLELQHLYLNPELNNEAIAFVQGIYMAVHASSAINAQVQRCGYCNALLTYKGCSLAGCRDDYPQPHPSDLLIPLGDAFLARPEVLKYWADPAREELRLYDALRRDTALRTIISLYPGSDRCDVAVGEEIGIDVKDYHDPVRLAHRLNRSLGGLNHYPRRIVAIARRRWSSTYRDRLLEQLSPERRTALQVMRVDDAITYIKKTYGGRRAHEA